MALSQQRGLWFEEYNVGDRAITVSRTITEADIVNFAGLSGDYNEIHVSETYAQGARAGRRIAHGLLGLSVASGLAFQLGFMRDTVDVFRALEWEFNAPIYIGDTIHVEIEVTETKPVPRLGNGKVMFKVSVKNQRSEVVQRGSWALLIRSRPPQP